MCAIPGCKSPFSEMKQQTCQVCTQPFDICSDCLWAVNDVCSFCGKAKCLECRQRRDLCQRVVSVAREGAWGTPSVNTFQMPAVEVGVATWNINHFENLPEEKTRAIEILFERHPWLDVLVIQELNATSSLKVTADGLTMEKGPKITSLSVGKQPKSDTAKTFYDKDVGRWITPRQQEYYPLVYRNSTVKYYKSTYLSHSKAKDESALCWTKAEALQRKYAGHRPIIIHTIIVQNQPVNIAIVHTTPEGSGLGRQGEYLQVLPMLEYMSKAGGFWIVAGDYYLDPEATTNINSNGIRPSEHLFRTKTEALGLQFAISISATNQSTLAHGTPCILDRVQRIVDGEERVVVNKRADFFIHNKGFVRTEAGVISPRGGLLSVDPDHHALNWWRRTSDHAPVGAILSSSARSPKIDEMQEGRWLEPGVMEKAQAQLGELYRIAAYQAARSVKTMHDLIEMFPRKPVFKLPVTKKLCVLLAEVSYTWSDWVKPYAEKMAAWKIETAGVSYREAFRFGDVCLRYTEKELAEISSRNEGLAELIEAIRQGRRALFTLDLDCIDFDLADEDDDYSDVLLR